MPALFHYLLGSYIHLHSYEISAITLQKLRMYKDRAEMYFMIAATAKADIALNNCIIKVNSGSKTESEFLAQLNIEMTKLEFAMSEQLLQLCQFSNSTLLY